MPLFRTGSTRFSLSLFVAAVGFLCAIADVARAEEVITFRNHVMPVLSKSGCNAGACHGNMNGKGGFKLSLRGEDPGADLLRITRDQQGRRIDLTRPDDSLLLRKASAAVAHQGGQRFAADSREYAIVRAWIAVGGNDDAPNTPRLTALDVAPGDTVLIEPASSLQLRAEATFSDGSRRDVTTLTVFEPSNQVAAVSPAGLVERSRAGEVTVLARFNDRQKAVRIAFVPARPDYAWSRPAEANYIDRHVDAKLKSVRMNPSPLSGDGEFIRRVFLDVLGVLPTHAEAQAFVADGAVDKRARVIDALLERPEFNDHWALKWSDLLRNEERVLDSKGVRAFHAWIRQSIAENKPIDRFVSELIAARGSTYENPASNFYRANRSADVRAEAAAQLFLGTRMQCAKCHNHPFDRWTQNDYYGFAAFFAPIDYTIVRNDRKDENDKMMFIGEQLVVMNEKSVMKHPGDGRTMKPAYLGDPRKVEMKGDGKADALQSLAGWMTSPSNPRFAAAQANRIWFHLLGKGIVDPIDDFRNTNPPSNPALLAALTDDFVKAKFDLRHLVRVICNSRTYQLSSEPTKDNEEDEWNFSHAFVRRLSAEQMLDAMSGVMGTPVKFNGVPEGYRAAQIPGVNAIYRDRRPSPGDRFLRTFGKPPRLMTCECERSNDTALGQVFELASGEAINDLLTEEDNRIGVAIRAGRDDRQIIEELYWSALSRPPKTSELAAALKLIEQVNDRRAALEDVAWGVLNAKEFVLRR